MSIVNDTLIQETIVAVVYVISNYFVIFDDKQIVVLESWIEVVDFGLFEVSQRRSLLYNTSFYR